MGSCQATSNCLSFLRPANRVKSIPPNQGAATGLFGLIFSCGSRNESLFLPKKCLLDEAGRGRRCHPRASRSRCIQFLSLWIQLHLLKIEQEGSHTMWLDLLFWYSIGGFSWFNSKRWDCSTMEHWQRERKKLTLTQEEHLWPRRDGVLAFIFELASVLT